MIEARKFSLERMIEMTQPIFLKPVLQDKIWGGRKLELEFGLKGPSDTVGEAWCISAHPNWA